jgi:signal transduction histidine kinase
VKSLRSQLILSHVLPLLILLPLLGALLLFVVESQVLLSDLTDEMARHAAALAQAAQVDAVIFQDRAQAQTFVENAARDGTRDVALYQADGAEWVALVRPNTRAAADPTQSELATLAAGNLQTRAAYNLDPAQIGAEALAPVLDPQRQLIGIVRVTARVEQVSARFNQMRVLILGAILLALLAAVSIGTYLAARMARRLNLVTQAVTQVAQGQRVTLPKNAMPQEFRATFDAVTALQARLLESETARKRLLANLVHELGRPLGALQAAIHALRQGADRDDALRQELLQGMDAQVERLKPLLDNLASLHGELDGVVALRRAPVNTSEWLHKVTLTWREAAQQKNLMWQENIAPDLPTVNMDADKMAQVLGNLLSNAIKYTPEGGGIELRAKAEARELSLAVQDTGIGIAAEDLPYIFDPLYRGSAASFGGANRFPQGMGLGLSIARDIVHAHGGRLQVESEPGKGSAFTVFLPL